MDVRFEILPTQLPRVDLSRQTSVVPADPDADEIDLFLDEDLDDTWIEISHQHSPVGLSLGRGVFLDENGNVALVPYRMFHPPLVPDSPEVQIDPPGLCNTRKVTPKKVGLRQNGEETRLGHLRVRPSKDGLTIDSRQTGRIKIHETADGLIVDGRQGRVKVKFTPEGATVQPSGWGSSSTTVSRQGDTITVNPPGLFNRIKTTVRDEGITVRSPYDPFSTTSLTSEQGSLTIDPPGWFNSTTIRF